MRQCRIERMWTRSFNHLYHIAHDEIQTIVSLKAVLRLCLMDDSSFVAQLLHNLVCALEVLGMAEWLSALEPLSLSASRTSSALRFSSVWYVFTGESITEFLFGSLRIHDEIDTRVMNLGFGALRKSDIGWCLVGIQYSGCA
jgi:hypothetical protein